MSLEIVREVDRRYPQLLQTNTGANCHQFTQYVIEHLRAAGHLAYLMCKTRGEGQYIPFGFQPRTVTGLDGKPYVCTGVSHDAIWCDGNQFDTIARANDGDDPIIENGVRLTGIPVWNAIKPEFWRPSNPPLKEPPVSTQPAPTQGVLPKGESLMVLKALNAFYQAPEGLQRPGGLVIHDHEGRSVADMEAIAQWFYQLVIERVSLEDVFTQIRNSHEWQSKHP
jgi:hypothetical protein